MLRGDADQGSVEQKCDLHSDEGDGKCNVGWSESG